MQRPPTDGEQRCVAAFFDAQRTPALRETFLCSLPFWYTSQASDAFEEFLIGRLDNLQTWAKEFESNPFMWRAHFCIRQLYLRKDVVKNFAMAYHTAVSTTKMPKI